MEACQTHQHGSLKLDNFANFRAEIYSVQSCLYIDKPVTVFFKWKSDQIKGQKSLTACIHKEILDVSGTNIL